VTPHGDTRGEPPCSALGCPWMLCTPLFSELRATRQLSRVFILRLPHELLWVWDQSLHVFSIVREAVCLAEEITREERRRSRWFRTSSSVWGQSEASLGDIDPQSICLDRRGQGNLANDWIAVRIRSMLTVPTPTPQFPSSNGLQRPASKCSRTTS